MEEKEEKIGGNGGRGWNEKMRKGGNVGTGGKRGLEDEKRRKVGGGGKGGGKDWEEDYICYFEKYIRLLLF